MQTATVNSILLTSYGVPWSITPTRRAEPSYARAFEHLVIALNNPAGCTWFTQSRHSCDVRAAAPFPARRHPDHAGAKGPLARAFFCGPRRSCALLVTHLRKREPCADGDHIQDGVRRVGRQAQTMKPFPGANPNIGRIRLGALLRELATLPFRTLIFFLCRTVGGSLDDVICGGQCHVCERVTTLRTGYTSA